MNFFEFLANRSDVMLRLGLEHAAIVGAAVVLAFFLGDFGAHNFYLSQPVRAVAHLLLLGLGIVLIVQGNAVSRELTHTAGIPAGADWYLGGLGIIAANGLWRFVEFIILLSTPEHRFAR